MASESLRASNDAVAVNVPAQYLPRLRHETEFSLGTAADTIDEALRFVDGARDDG